VFHSHSQAQAEHTVGMGFAGVYRALYDYEPQADGELAIEENDLLYILDNTGEDGWWKAKKRARADDEDEPTGLVPQNYMEKVCVEPPQGDSRQCHHPSTHPHPIAVRVNITRLQIAN
jgi:hypothetical protein